MCSWNSNFCVHLWMCLISVTDYCEDTRDTIMKCQVAVRIASDHCLLSLRFNGHFPGEPRLANVYWGKGLWRYGGGGDNWTTGAISRAKLQSNHHHRQTNIYFLQAGCPSCHPTNSVWRENITFHGLACSLGVFQLCLWPLIAPSNLGGGLLCLSSALWCQYPDHCLNNLLY